ncbi:transforming growth factor-beta receptor type 3-like protein [Mergus octosetaceus]
MVVTGGTGGHWEHGGDDTVVTGSPAAPPRLRLDVSGSPEFPPAPGPRAVPAGAARLRADLPVPRPPGLGFSLRRCSVSPRSAPGGAPGPPRGLSWCCGGAAGGRPGGARRGGGSRRRLLLSFRLPPRFAEPLQFLHCRLRLLPHRGRRGRRYRLPALTTTDPKPPPVGAPPGAP